MTKEIRRAEVHALIHLADIDTEQMVAELTERGLETRRPALSNNGYSAMPPIGSIKFFDPKDTFDIKTLRAKYKRKPHEDGGWGMTLLIVGPEQFSALGGDGWHSMDECSQARIATTPPEVGFIVENWLIVIAPHGVRETW